MKKPPSMATPYSMVSGNLLTAKAELCGAVRGRVGRVGTRGSAHLQFGLKAIITAVNHSGYKPNQVAARESRAGRKTIERKA